MLPSRVLLVGGRGERTAKRCVRRLCDRTALAFVFVALGLSACGSQAPPNLLIVVVDTLRRDHLGAYGYERDTSPHIDALAAESFLFRRAYTAAPWTQPSVASLITGLHPSGHTVDRLVSFLPEAADTLAEILSGAGYATVAVVSHWIIGSRYKFDQGYEVFLEDQGFGREPFSTPGVSNQAIGLLEGFMRDERPFFLFVHYFDPHFEYRRHSEYGFAAEAPGRLHGRESIDALRSLDPPPDPEERRFIRDLYDEEIRFTDAGVGSLLESLERLALDGDTLVVFLADHGEEFFERGWLGHAQNLYEEVLRVPLLIRLPGSRGGGRTIDEPVSLVSVTPTLLDLLGVDRSGLSFQGPSFSALLGGDGEFSAGALYFETSLPRKSIFKHALLQGDFKLIVDRESGERELYDLGRDPGERQSLVQREPQLADAMAAQLEEIARRTEADALRHRPRAARTGKVDAPSEGALMEHDANRRKSP